MGCGASTADEDATSPTPGGGSGGGGGGSSSASSGRRAPSLKLKKPGTWTAPKAVTNHELDAQREVRPNAWRGTPGAGAWYSDTPRLVFAHTFAPPAHPQPDLIPPQQTPRFVSLFLVYPPTPRPRLKKEFWHTRVDGIETIWNALRMSADAVRSGDLGLAEAITEASLISLPNGDLGLCYDERGNKYILPKMCYSDPDNLLSGAAVPTPASGGESKAPSGGDGQAVKAQTFEITVRVGGSIGLVYSSVVGV